MNIDTSSIPVTGLPAKAAPVQPSVPATNDAPETASAVPSAALRAAVSAASEAVRAFSNNLEFSVDQHSGRTIVRIVDAETRQLVRQLPSEEMLAIARALDKLQGMLIRDQA